VTAQDLFRHLMRDLITPALLAMGLRGGYSGSFWIEHGDYGRSSWTKKDRYSTKTEVDFWIHLDAVHGPTRRNYWRKDLDWLTPDKAVGRWTVEIGSPLQPVAESVLDAIRRYGLPAMQAALDSPGFPPTPVMNGHACFPAADDGVVDGPLDLGEIAWVLRPLNQDADQWLPMLTDPNADRRMQALPRLFDLDLRSSSVIGCTVIFSPSTAASSTKVPSVGLGLSTVNSLRIASGDLSTARARSAFDIPQASRRASISLTKASTAEIRSDVKIFGSLPGITRSAPWSSN
jgi:hypothetical protein